MTRAARAKVPEGFRIVQDNSFSEDGGATFYCRTVLQRMVPYRHGFLWLKKGVHWVTIDDIFAGWFGTAERHLDNTKSLIYTAEQILRGEK